MTRRAWILPDGKIEDLATDESHGNAVVRLLGKSTGKTFDPFASGWLRLAGNVVQTGDLRNPQLGTAFAEAIRATQGPVIVSHPGGDIEVPVARGREFLANAAAGVYSPVAPKSN